MHIPDGYLSPATCAVGFAVAVPTVAVTAARVKRVVKSRQVPTLAMLSAMCFVVMMFNVPIPDGTTAHAVGGALVAVLLGPWAAVVAVTVALAFQALLFGDGGVMEREFPEEFARTQASAFRSCTDISVTNSFYHYYALMTATGPARSHARG